MEHSFISITVQRVDARVAADGGVEYAEAPDERQPDKTPEHICEICKQFMTPEVVLSACPGPEVPDDISTLLSD